MSFSLIHEQFAMDKPKDELITYDLDCHSHLSPLAYRWDGLANQTSVYNL